MPTDWFFPIIYNRFLVSQQVLVNNRPPPTENEKRTKTMIPHLFVPIVLFFSFVSQCNFFFTLLSTVVRHLKLILSIPLLLSPLSFSLSFSTFSLFTNEWTGSVLLARSSYSDLFWVWKKRQKKDSNDNREEEKTHHQKYNRKIKFDRLNEARCCANGMQKKTPNDSRPKIHFNHGYGYRQALGTIFSFVSGVTSYDEPNRFLCHFYAQFCAHSPKDRS